MRTDANKNADLVSTGLAGALGMASAMGFGRFSFTPILPGMLAGLPLSSTDAGLIAAGNFAGYLVGAVLGAYGWAAGRERSVALAALVFTALLQLAMGLSSSLWLFVLIRFAAGVASAFALIFLSAIVLGHAAARGNDHVQSAHFGGVGAGIALSSLVVLLISASAAGSIGGWRLEWSAGAAISLAIAGAVWRLLPAMPSGQAQAIVEPPVEWKLPLVLVTLAYGLFGFGYVITATFVVTMARLGDAGPMVEFFSWFLAGLAAAVSLLVWRPFMQRFGLAAVFVTGLLVEAMGVLASVILPLPFAALVGGVLLGATFLMITAYGLRIGRLLAPRSPRRALAFMTAAFGVGQILGPLVAGAMAERTGSFTAPTMVAAVVLFAAVLVVLPVRRSIP
ncbi:YbfB/YjiJ family MFS transporter [Rhizobium sp. WL3]|uniref:YbfB/YjiJ family MFS transporter n=1 Tax=Rhizobium sp. WL3 TaxID=2603277 RepID=UPI0011C20213|nr:YbfB/YjiJ family MFS transporter [Rhizobium sp. WL3]QEE44606.1 YbfB/YjiJ family MFS transporter [Rhizobium sp. WL3]